MGKKFALAQQARLDRAIIFIRGEKIMLDSDLAELYGVDTKRLNEQVKRNAGRFPPDFVFQLTLKEKMEVVANCDHLHDLKFSSTLPYAFTEHGAIMAASVLNSKRAVDASVFVVRAFVKLRELLASHKELAAKMQELESRVEGQDESLRQLVTVIRDMMEPLKEKRGRRIGFRKPAVKK